MAKPDTKKIIDYWQKSAQKDLQTANSLLLSKRYDACLFFCHLTLEKILKGLIVARTKSHAPYIHELDKLARKTELKLSKEQMENLKIISTFNVNARYDDVKFSFYKKCTKEYTEKYFGIFKKLYSWLRKQYPKK